MALHSLYLFAARIAALAKDWEPEELEKLERCREFCRNLCLKAGLAHDTQCLCDLWVALTSAKVKLTSEMEGHDIDENSTGVMRCRSISWDFIQKMNVYERFFSRKTSKPCKACWSNSLTLNQVLLVEWKTVVTRSAPPFSHVTKHVQNSMKRKTAVSCN